MISSGAQLVQVPFSKLKNIHFSVQHIVHSQLHAHSGLELGLVLEGTLDVHFGTRNGHVSKNELMLFNGYQAHNMWSQDGATVLFLQISSNFGKDYLGQLSNMEFDSAALHALDAESAQRVRQHMIHGARAYFADSPDMTMECAGRVAYILAELIRGVPYQFHTDADQLAKKKKIGRAQRIADFLERHYKEKMTLTQLAESEGLTTTYMSRIFSELFQSSFQDYLSSYRLQKALPLLRKPDMFLLDICMECGFSDTRYLNAVCQREFGCSALQLRYKMLAGDWQDPSDAQQIGKNILTKEQSAAFLRHIQM